MPKFEVAKRLLAWLNEGKRAASMEMTDEERAAAKGLFLLTMKPILYVANVDEDMLNEDLAPIDGVKPLPICAKIEAELSELDPEDAADYLESLGLEQPGLDVLAQAAYKLLGLQSFFTAGEMEVKAWTVRQGATARRPPVSSTPTLSAALLRPRSLATTTTSSSVASRAPRLPASCVLRQGLCHGRWRRRALPL